VLEELLAAEELVIGVLDPALAQHLVGQVIGCNSTPSTSLPSTATTCESLPCTCARLAPFEQGEIGADLFKAACNMMLERLRDSSIGLARRGTGSRSKILPHLR
jgi:hypothetical protein